MSDLYGSLFGDARDGISRREYTRRAHYDVTAELEGCGVVIHACVRTLSFPRRKPRTYAAELDIRYLGQCQVFQFLSEQDYTDFELIVPNTSLTTAPDLSHNTPP